MKYFAAFALIGLLVGGAATLSFAAADDEQYDVPYVPTPMKTVAKMLEMARVGPTDIIYDLGSGDGRIVIAAVRDFGARKGVGVDINPVRIQESNENARRARLTDKVRFVEGDVFEFDFSEATVLTMYLLTEVNIRLRPRLLATLKPGTRVVSHDFDMAEWEPDDIASMDSFRNVYMWIIPSQVGGEWDVTMGGTRARLSLDQEYQRVTGELRMDGGTFPVKTGRLTGAEIDFGGQAIEDGRVVPARYVGKVVGADTMEGHAEVGGRRIPFTARRTRAAAR